MKLKLSEMASIAEVIGAFAVVVSLIYVGVQVNDSTRAVRAASANDANVAVQSWCHEVGSDQQTSELFYRILMNGKPESAAEEFQFMMMFQGAFLAFQNSFLLAQEGTIDAELHDGLTGAILIVKDTPGMALYWPQRRITLHPDFVAYVDDLIERDAETTMDIYRTSDADGGQE